MRTRRLVAIGLAAALLGASCTGSATIEQASQRENPAATVEPTSAAEPTAVAPTLVPQTVAVPTDVPVVPTPVATTPADFRTDALLGLSADGVYAFAGTSTPWNDPTSCSADERESVAVVEVEAALAGVVDARSAGVVQAGDVRQMLVNNSTDARSDRVAILSSCVAGDTTEFWLQQARVGAGGQLENLGARTALSTADNETYPYLLRHAGADRVELRVIVEVDPDDFDSWLIEHRQIDMATGQVTVVQQFSYFDDTGGGRVDLISIEGFGYTAIDDPAGALGCEGAGVARTIEVQTEAGTVLALGNDGPVYSDVGNMHYRNGYIAWTSGCEGYVSAYVGKVLPDGLIADAHLIETFSLPDQDWSEFQHYRLTNDGFLAASGLTFSPQGSDGEPAFLRYDLGSDPHFVTTADPAPAIDDTPLLTAARGTGSWHVGDTLAAEPACGGQTLYGKSSTGYVRAFPAGIEIDAIVDADAAEVLRSEYEDREFVGRTVVVSTVCPGDYDGRRVWFGFEGDTVQWGMTFQQADIGEVRRVLSVRDEVEPDTTYAARSYVEVELLDGTITEFELVALPFDS